MKKIFLTIALAIMTTFSFATKPHIDNVSVNTKNSTIKWIGSKITSNHEGTINILNGALNIEHGVLVGGQFTIDMQSLATTDMSEEYNKKLDGHLKNEDFFNVSEFPTALVEIQSVKKIKNNDLSITANLTIKGITHSIQFNADVAIKGLHFQAKAIIKIDRTKWDIKYNSGNFFEDLGDKLILDEIILNVFLLSVK